MMVEGDLTERLDHEHDLAIEGSDGDLLLEARDRFFTLEKALREAQQIIDGLARNEQWPQAIEVKAIIDTALATKPTPEDGDIVKRLLALDGLYGDDVCKEAADHILQLRAELVQLRYETNVLMQQAAGKVLSLQAELASMRDEPVDTAQGGITLSHLVDPPTKDPKP